MGLAVDTWPIGSSAIRGAVIQSPVLRAAASRLEHRCYADRQGAGVAYAGVLVGAAIGFGVALERQVSHRALATVMTTAVATWAVLGGESLNRRRLQLPGSWPAGN